MKKNEEKEFQLTTKEKVKQIRRWENLPDDLAEQIAKTVIKFAELFYITIARNMSLNPIPESELQNQEEKPKRRKKKQRQKNNLFLMFVFVF